MSSAVFTRGKQRFRQIQSDLRQNINAKLAALTNPNPKGPPVPADDQYVQPLLTFFEKKFRWSPGEYEMVLQIKTEPNRASINKRYRLTLFESESKELADRRDKFKYGFGVYIDIPGLITLGVPLTQV